MAVFPWDHPGLFATGLAARTPDTRHRHYDGYGFINGCLRMSERERIKMSESDSKRLDAIIESSWIGQRVDNRGWRVRNTVALLQIDELNRRDVYGVEVFIFAKGEERPVRDGFIPQG